jgi:hypothetical protein
VSTPTGEPRHSSDTGVPGKNDDPLRSPYAPKWVRTRPNPEPDSVRSGDTVALPPVHSPKGSRKDFAEPRQAVDVDDSGRYLDDPAGQKRAPKMPMSQQRGDQSSRTAVETTAPLRPLVDPASARPTPASDRRRSATERRAETLSDLDRLEACLLQVQREEAATRLPRAAQLPPVPGLASVGQGLTALVLGRGHWSPSTWCLRMP